MYYSFEFAANVTRSCIEEIRKRGLQERKIFRKTVPNYGLFIKIFNKGDYTTSDISYVDIHSVATLMQAALWSTPDRIISKKAWREINYETCKLSDLSETIPKRSEEFLVEILDFLVELLQYKSFNRMDAYNLGDSLGKVVLGPNGCSQIMEEKSGHFLTRLIIEHAKLVNHERLDPNAGSLRSRVDSGYESFSSKTHYDSYVEHHPLCKSEGTQARAKFYRRAISKTHQTAFDWIDYTEGVQSMLDDDYKIIPDPPEKPWISIFTSQEALELSGTEMKESSTLYRILREAVKPPMVIPLDPFAESYLFNKSTSNRAESQIHGAFHQFLSLQARTDRLTSNNTEDKSNPLKKLNSSLSHLKLNIKKYRSRHDLSEESVMSESTMVNDSNIVEPEYVNMQQQHQKHNLHNMKSAMRKIIKVAGDRKNNKVLL
ncbi:unnamed protein product [Rhizopus stolonifer]